MMQTRHYESVSFAQNVLYVQNARHHNVFTQFSICIDYLSELIKSKTKWLLWQSFIYDYCYCQCAKGVFALDDCRKFVCVLFFTSVLLCFLWLCCHIINDWRRCQYSVDNSFQIVCRAFANYLKRNAHTHGRVHTFELYTNEWNLGESLAWNSTEKLFVEFLLNKDNELEFFIASKG